VMRPWKRRPSRTVRRTAAIQTVKELRYALAAVHAELESCEDLARRDRLRDLQLRYAARIARLGAVIDEA